MSGQGRGRTADTTIFSRVLYQLSYLTVHPGEPGPAAPRSCLPEHVCPAVRPGTWCPSRSERT